MKTRISCLSRGLLNHTNSQHDSVDNSQHKSWQGHDSHDLGGLRIIPEVNGAYVCNIFIYYQQNVGHLLTSLMINVN